MYKRQAQVSPDEVKDIEGVDIVARTNEKQNLLAYLESFHPEEDQVQCHIRDYEQLDTYISSGIITSMESVSYTPLRLVSSRVRDHVLSVGARERS